MDSGLVTVLVPVVLAVIMFGLGMSLSVGDFRRVREYPKVVIAALGCQLVVLPAVCFGLVVAFGLAAAPAVGMMLLAASPGGTMANLYSHLFGGDVALNITLTAINSVLAVFTLPLVVNLAVGYWDVSGEDGSVGLQFGKTLQVFALVLIPVAVGMVVRAKRPGFAERAERPVKILCLVILAGVIVAALLAERSNVGEYLAEVGPVAVLFSFISLATGYAAARGAGAGHPQAVAACMEIGMHNTSLSLTIALSPSLLDSTEIAVPSAVYAILMYFTAGAAGMLLRKLDVRQTSRRISPRTR
ncbi:bile acid:sodium symporter family protein [Streptomyces sp. TRM66268-LWL]|uniref:Bile acid:sodium symporter family protein n=1 Tax=Streptomyces polyasparticus TaxID=2767826 RepID=A0ABR7SC06_9ACTN|nr:bile acid:sodium symporter family protein [Streptomyces polyasparticus]MBC9712031.1 bile acid:sodium symporter family protein [Streptomyces polyasparticus]